MAGTLQGICIAMTELVCLISITVAGSVWGLWLQTAARCFRDCSTVVGRDEGLNEGLGIGQGMWLWAAGVVDSCMGFRGIGTMRDTCCLRDTGSLRVPGH